METQQILVDLTPAQVDPHPPILPPYASNNPSPEDFSILKVEMKQAVGEPLPADVRTDLAPGVHMVIGRRHVMRRTLFEATRTNNTSTLPYYGLIQPEKKDIKFLVSIMHGIQAIYERADSVDEPILMDNQVPTMTIVSFMYLIMDFDVLAEHLQRDGRPEVAPQLEEQERAVRPQRPMRALSSPFPPPYEYDTIRAYFKRKREDDEEFDRRAEKRAKADNTNSKISFYLMGIATGVAVSKYLL